MLYLTSLSYIDLVHYGQFKSKHNLYSNERTLNAWLIVLHISWIYGSPFRTYQKLILDSL